VNRSIAYWRGVNDYKKKHGQGVNCPYKPGWAREYWLQGYRWAMRKTPPSQNSLSGAANTGDQQ
jgi:ribosome modulation factor